MKPFFLCLLLAAFLFSCNNADSDKKAADADTTQDAGTTPGAGKRTVTEAIAELKTTLESNDANKIAELFDFPIADTVMGVFLDDSVFKKSYTAAGDKLTKKLFIQYFDTISRSNNLTDIREGFKYWPIHTLRFTDKIVKEFKDKKEPCTRSYSIEVEGDEVRLIYSTNQNDQFVIPKGQEDNEEYFSGCEYAAFWFFRFDGNRLKFTRFAAAG